MVFQEGHEIISINVSRSQDSVWKSVFPITIIIKESHQQPDVQKSRVPLVVKALDSKKSVIFFLFFYVPKEATCSDKMSYC